MLKASRRVLNRLQCWMDGHNYGEVFWPGYGDAPHRVWNCRRCNKYKIVESRPRP